MLNLKHKRQAQRIRDLQIAHSHKHKINSIKILTKIMIKMLKTLALYKTKENNKIKKCTASKINNRS